MPQLAAGSPIGRRPRQIPARGGPSPHGLAAWPAVCAWCGRPVAAGAGMRLDVEQGSGGGAVVLWHRSAAHCAPRDPAAQPRRHP